MWTEIALGGGLVMAGGKLMAEVTGESKKRREEAMERAVEKHFNSMNESQDNDMEES